MRFTIRDLLWLMAVVAMLAVVWTDRASITRERALLKKEAAAERESLKRHWADLERVRLRIDHRDANLDREVRERVTAAVDKAMPRSEPELEVAKRRSAELGAPQPKPLPDGY